MEQTKNENESTIAIASFDGEAPHIVKATSLRICVPTRSCVQFWATTICCFLVIAMGMVFMLIDGTTSPYYSVGLALLGLGTGVLIPGLPSCYTQPFWRRLTVLICHIGTQDPIMEVSLAKRREMTNPLVMMLTRKARADRHKMHTGCWSGNPSHFQHSTFQSQENCYMSHT